MSIINTQPLITIITITFNSEQFLKQTIESVISQSYKNIEYIIIDGGSTDATLNIIRRYEEHLSKWISEPDEGIADAMNKGVNMSNGEYIYFLHSDDHLYSDHVIQNFVDFQTTDSTEIYAGSVMFSKSDGENIILMPRGYSLWLNFKTGFLHQGTFCKKTVFEEIGGFDEQFKIAMDYDFFLRAYRNKVPCKKYDSIITIMRDTGISSRVDWDSLKQRFNEERLVHKKNCKAWKLTYPPIWALYYAYRYLKSIF